MKYDVLYDDGEEVLSNVSLEEAQAYVYKHRFDCFSRTLIMRKHYEWTRIPSQIRYCQWFSPLCGENIEHYRYTYRYSHWNYLQWVGHRYE